MDRIPRLQRFIEKFCNKHNKKMEDLTRVEKHIICVNWANEQTGLNFKPEEISMSYQKERNEFTLRTLPNDKDNDDDLYKQKQEDMKKDKKDLEKLSKELLKRDKEKENN